MARRVSKRPDVRRDEMMDDALRLCIDVGYEPLFGAGDVRFHQKPAGRGL